MTRPLASLSLDLDNKWSYMKTHCDPGWESFPSYLDVLVPRVLSFLETKDLKVTFFIVGQDAAIERNREALRSIASAGHEIGNHSFKHEPWLHLYSNEEIEAEIASAEEHIEQATGQRPLGFRGPGFSLSLPTLQILEQRGYLYDATTFPTFVGPLTKAYYFRSGNFTHEAKSKRKFLGGGLRDGLRPLKPYRWKIESSALVEMPVTTMPIFRMPIHVSYLVWLATYSKALALFYFRMALLMCRFRGIQPSLLLHPTDFLDDDDAPELWFFPGIDLPCEQKMELLSEILSLYVAQFNVVTIRQHVEMVAGMAILRVIEPNFQHYTLDKTP